MKRLKQHWTAGPLAGLLSTALALPSLLAWLPALAWLLAAPQPARAQTLNRMPTWAVVNFVNNSGYGGNEVGIEASDGFVVELGKSNRYDVLPRSQTQATIRDLGLVEPLDHVALQKLARSLEADAVATGEVASVTFSKSPRRATVSLIIRVVDRVSGELVNGAIAQGTSNAQAIAINDDDALVNQAIENAAFNAVKEISRFNLPHATVLIHRDPATVTVNKGTQDGLYNGLSMLVTRRGAEVGRIRITNAGPDESEAVVTDQGIGITTDDIATAIYQLPGYSTGPGGVILQGSTVHSATTSGATQSRSFLSGPFGVIAAAAVGAALFGLARNGSSSGSIGGGQPGGGSAALDFNATSGITPPAENPTNLSTFIPAAIRLDFNAGNINGGNLLEYHIFRDPQPISLSSAVGNFNPPTAITAEFAPLPIIVTRNSPAFDSIQDVNPIFERLPDPTNNTAFISGDFFQSGTPTTSQFPLSGTGLEIGDRVRYRIQALYTVPNLNTTGATGTGVNTGTGPLIYSVSEPIYTNYVTYLQPPLLHNTTPDFKTDGVTSSYPTGNGAPVGDPFGFSTGPSNVTVNVPSVFINPAGATSIQYALEFSTSASFPTNSTYRITAETTPGGATEQNPRTGAAVSFKNIDLTTGTARNVLGTNPGIVYVRVGVRDLRNGSDTGSGGGSNPFAYSSLDPDPTTARALPAPLTPGGGATALLRSRAIAHAAVVAAPGSHLRSSAGTPPVIVHPALTPSGSLHPSAAGGTFQPITPPRELPAHTHSH